MKFSDIDSRLNALSRHNHCCNCGELDPEVGDYAAAGDSGFTLCCNEAVCQRDGRYAFGDSRHRVEACCWAVAELKFQKEGIDVSGLSEIRRTKLDEASGE